MDKQIASNNQQSKDSRLRKGAVFLFGPRIVERCEVMSIDALTVEAGNVAEAARMLRQLSGAVEQQKEIIREMSDETALALCRWIIDPGCMAGMVAPHIH